MSITFRCEHCRKSVNAPDEAAGRRGKCPHCGGSSYIPLPKSQVEEEIPLAEEDEDEERRMREEIRSLIHQDPAIVMEEKDAAQPAVPLEHKPDLRSEDLYHFVVNFCMDMFKGNLDRTKVPLTELKKFKYTAISAVEDFQNGKAHERVLDVIPKKVLQGFLNTLKEQLKS